MSRDIPRIAFLSSSMLVLAGAMSSLPACGGGEDDALFEGKPDADSDDASQNGDVSLEAGSETGSEAASEEGGAEASDDAAAAEAGACDVCDGNSYVPCTAGGTPGQPLACSSLCLDGLGCAACTPGALSCEGNVVLRCKADGTGTEAVETCAGSNVCAQGACEDACAVAASYQSNLGCEFWAADLDQQDGYDDPATPPIGVFVANPGSGAAVVTVEVNSAAPGAPVQASVVVEATVGAGASHTFSLPTRELDCGAKPNDYAAPGTCLSSRAFRIRSTRPVSAVQFNTAEALSSNDASLLLPTHALGKSYRALGWPAGHPVLIQGYNIVDRSYVTIVGTTANTQVTVSPTWRIKGNPPIAATQPGGKIVATLGPFDVLNLETDDGTFQDNPATIADLSGTAIEASAPVAVFSGVESTGAPNGVIDIPKFSGWTDEQTCCLDHLEDLMLPAQLSGASYAVARSPVRSAGGFREPDIIRFVGVVANTQVATSLPAPFDSFVLQPGEVRTTWAQDNVAVSATAPLMVGQILVSGQYSSPSLGDPSMSLLVPVEQFRTAYDFLAPTSYAKSYVVVTAEAGTTVKLDGQPTSLCLIEPLGELGGKTWQSRRCQLMPGGAHRITSDRPVGVMVYGYSSAASYSYAAGIGPIPAAL